MKPCLTYNVVKNLIKKGFISPLNHKSTIYDDFAKEAKDLGIKSGYIRSNSTKKIKWLLNNATCIELKLNSNNGFSEKVSKEYVNDCLEKYKGNPMSINLRCSSLTKCPEMLTIKICPGFGTFYITFNKSY